MKISVVTVSFNQANFLERTIQSVLSQDGVEIEYIICDPGSTDGSRDIIEKYRDQIAHVVYEKDDGAPDGLNKGFAHATGDIYYYLNSDDTLEPGAFARIAKYMEEHPEYDVVCGHAWVTDPEDNRLRRVWSQPYWPWSVAYGASTQIQPSTFIRREAYLKSDGFNTTDRRNWDGGLLASMYSKGAKIGVINAFLSTYRLHNESITSSGQGVDEATQKANDESFENIMGRKTRPFDKMLRPVFRVIRHLLFPKSTYERVFHGPVFGRKIS